MSIMAADVFWMGSLDSEPNRSDCELRHRMRLGRTIAIASKKVTASQLQGFMTENAEDLQRLLRSYHFDSEKAPRPAEVNWFIAAAYCNWLSKKEGIPESEWCYPQFKASEFRGGMKLYPDYLRRTGYRLPTEAEWEFACRSGADTSYSFGECEVRLRNYGWYGENSADRSHPVASLKPNDFGLFDMHGNVGEWCQDRYRGEYVPGKGGKPADDLEDTENVLDDPGHDRVVRGGVFGAPSYCLRSAYRFATPPGHPPYFTGFRPARTCR
jgi:formylglycine-generating enzyme required for sulfatase activity